MSIEINGQRYRELRCTNCRKMICYEYVHEGVIGFQCPRCGRFSVFNFESWENRKAKGVDAIFNFKLKSKNAEGVRI